MPRLGEIRDTEADNRRKRDKEIDRILAEQRRAREQRSKSWSPNSGMQAFDAVLGTLAGGKVKLPPVRRSR